jgi:replicative DNA helicase
MLKSYSRHYATPVLALAQLSRKIEERKGKDAKPLLSDLRESGAIEQDADLVTFIYVPEDLNANTSNVDNRESRNALNIEYIIAKHRNGSTADISLVFHKETSKIFESNPFKKPN